jgi:hypothetical protein
MDIGKTVKDAVDNASDIVKEALHRSTAEAEHARREAGDPTMTTGQKIASVANEAKNRVEASVVKARREARKHL